MNEIIPFGKYKGQQIEVLSGDPQYRDWLMQQEWFRTRFSNLRTIIVNNFGTPAETPEHNELQALFTNDDWVRRFLIRYVDGQHKTIQKKIQDWNDRSYQDWVNRISSIANSLTVEIKNNEARLSSPSPWDDVPYMLNRKTKLESLLSDLNRELIEDYKNFILPNSFEIKITSINYECGGIDVVVHAHTIPSGVHWRLAVECKPSMSDDYPAVLRQITASMYAPPKTYHAGYVDTDLWRSELEHVLLLGNGGYTGIGATFEEVQKIFSASRIRIIPVSSINADE